MEISNKINKRYKFQIISLIIVTLTYIPLGAFVISAFFCKEYFNICLIVFMGFLLIDVAIVILFFHLDIVSLPPINSIDVLYKYLEYYSYNDLSDFKYITVVGSFSKLIKAAHNRKTAGEDRKFDELVSSLYMVLRSDEEYEERCVAAYHKKSFIKLVNAILDGTYRYEQIIQMEKEPKDVDDSIKGNVVKFFRKNLSIEVFLLAVICHIAGCFMKGEGIVAQLLLALPPDFIMILVFFGIVKEHKED